MLSAPLAFILSWDQTLLVEDSDPFESGQVILASAIANALPRYPLFKDQQLVEYIGPLLGCQGTPDETLNPLLNATSTLNENAQVAILRPSEERA